MSKILPSRKLGTVMYLSNLYRLVCFSVCLLFPAGLALAEKAEKPNVLFVAIDDLNDWVGCFGGHPEAITPNLDRFAEEGSVVFQNAHCPGPVCGPSRSALLSGFMPYRSGIYGNSQNMLDSGLVQTHATLPEYFSGNGYFTVSRGKIAHRQTTAKGSDPGHWMYDSWVPSPGGYGVDRSTVTSRDKNLIHGKKAPPSKHTKSSGSEFAWGVTRGGVRKTNDFLTAQWAAEELQKSHDKPFFLAVGLSKPHLPFYSPQEFWDLYPEDKNYRPEIRENDFDDILLPNGKKAGGKTKDYLWLEQNNLLNEAARAYLACTSFADHCVGTILDGLRTSPHADNTIVVIWGDHGWHLGEKLRYRKGSLWSESTRCPLIVKLPGSEKPLICRRPVNLIDLYPTLIELCHLPEKKNLDGTSFVPLLKNPGLEWQPTLTIRGEGNASVHDDRWNLIFEKKGVRELYDVKNDPMEWTNLFGKPEVQEQQAALEKFLPARYEKQLPPVEKSKGKPGLDETIRPHRLKLDLQ
ncbi:MAG: sulfatase [Verrucomicrobiales bacterium]|nr:sulfatase [Verrucomicrobiales bacterium]